VLEIFAGIMNLDVPENRWVTLYHSETLVLDAILGKFEDGVLLGLANLGLRGAKLNLVVVTIRLTLAQPISLVK
jgi:hypothetical protein